MLEAQIHFAVSHGIGMVLHEICMVLHGMVLHGMVLRGVC